MDKLLRRMNILGPPANSRDPRRLIVDSSLTALKIPHGSNFRVISQLDEVGDEFFSRLGEHTLRMELDTFDRMLLVS